METNNAPENNLPFHEQEPELIPEEPKKKRTFFKNHKKGLIITGSILLILLLVIFVVPRLLPQGPAAALDVRTVEKGEIAVTISAEGVIEPLSEHEIVPQVQGEVLSAPYEVGQTVQKDAVLFTIDADNVSDSIEKSKNALDRSKSTYNQSRDALSDLRVYAPFTGVIANSYVKVGDSIQAGAKIADMVNSDQMKLTVPFLEAQAGALFVGQTADVTVAGTYYTLTGTITGIPSGSVLNAQNLPVKNIEITVQNPGAIGSGQSATAIAGGVACNAAGTFDYSESKTVVAKSSGTVQTLPYKAGDKVNAGALMLQVENKATQNTVEQNGYAVRDAELALDSSQKQLDNYVVKSPISGTIITKDVKAGDVIGSSMTKTVLATVADLSVLTIVVKIDELDIEKVREGQTVEVTADALPDNTFAAHVESIGIKGTAENGVTTYPVTIKMDEKDGLMPGMNVNAKIMIEQKTDVLTVPVSAVMRGNKVVIQDGSAKNEPQSSDAAELMSNGDPLPAGFKFIEVEIGLNDEENIEITGGLSEGDTILIPTPKTTKQNTMEMMMNAEMGSGGGGRSSGGGGASDGGSASGGGAQ